MEKGETKKIIRGKKDKKEWRETKKGKKQREEENP